MASIEYITNADQIDIDLHQISKEDFFSIEFEYDLNSGTERFISEHLNVSFPESGLTTNVNSSSGYFIDLLYPDTIPPVSYIDGDSNEVTVSSYDQLPDLSDPDFRTLSDYRSSTIQSRVIEFNYVLTYEFDDEENNQTIIKTLEEHIEINVYNNWNGDKTNVEAATQTNSGKPIATINSPTSGHGTYPPTGVASASSKVFIGGAGALRTGDPLIPHTSVVSPHPTHAGTAVGGSPKVFIEGKVAVRIGDPGSCGGVISVGVGKVLCN